MNVLLTPIPSTLSVLFCIIIVLADGNVTGTSPVVGSYASHLIPLDAYRHWVKKLNQELYQEVIQYSEIRSDHATIITTLGEYFDTFKVYLRPRYCCRTTMDFRARDVCLEMSFFQIHLLEYTSSFSEENSPLRKVTSRI